MHQGKQLEDMIIQMGRQGRLQQQLDDKGLKGMLEQVRAPPRRPFGTACHRLPAPAPAWLEEEPSSAFGSAHRADLRLGVGPQDHDRTPRMGPE